MPSTIYGVTSPVLSFSSSGGVDEAGLQTYNEVETVKRSARAARIATLAAGVGTATTSEITGGILKSISWQDIAGGLSEITKTFRSSGLNPGETSGPDPGDPEDEIPGERFTFEAVAQEQPILTHPKFAALTDPELTLIKLWSVGDTEKAQAGEPGSPSALYLKAKEYILNETTGYLAPSFVLKRQGVTARANLTWLNVGKRANPPASTGVPSTFGSSQNWLFAGQNAVSYGSGQLDFEQTFLGSGPGGWDTFLYG